MTYLRLIFFAIFSMCLWSKSAVACQEGVRGQDVNSHRVVQAEGIIITWSETNDELRGFSQKLGEWEVLEIEPQKLNPGQTITPVVAANVAAVRFGDSIAAFSGEKGWWDVVELSKDSTAVPVVHPSLAVFEDNGHLYTFSSSKGSWSSPTDPELQPATFEVSLKSGPVEDGKIQFEAWLAQQPQHEARRISLTFMYNRPSMITTTRQSTMNLVRQKIEEFWCPKTPAVDEATPVPEPIRSSAEIDTQITKLREDLTRLESTVQAGSGQSSNPNVDQDQQSRELRKLVEQSFDLRQQLQELEAQRLRLKLQQVENNLAVRAKSRDAMVARRMEEVLSSSRTSKEPVTMEPALASSFTRRAIKIAEEIADRYASDHDGVFCRESGMQAWKIFQSPSLYKGRRPRPYISEPPIDSWGNVLRYEPNQTGDGNSSKGSKPFIWSMGPNGKDEQGNGDDIKNWSGPFNPALPANEVAGQFQTEFNPERPTKDPLPKAANSVSTVQWPQPGEIARQLRSFRESAVRYMEDIRDPKMSVETWSQPLEKLIADGLLDSGAGEDARRGRLAGAEDRAEHLEKRLTTVRRDWNYAWSAYQTQLQLLRLDVQQRHNELTVATSESNLKSESNAKRPQTFSPSEISRAEANVERCNIELKRAERLLKLYTDIEANEPELNPASLEGLDEIAAGKETAASFQREPGQNLPQQVISMAEQLRKLREDAEKLREDHQSQERLIVHYSQPLERVGTKTISEKYTLREGVNELTLVERGNLNLQHSERIKRVSNFDAELLTIQPSDGDPTQLNVFALKPGATTVSIEDESGRTFSVDVFVLGDVRHLETILRREYPNDNILLTEISEQMLSIRGTVKDPASSAEIQKIAEQHYPQVLNHLVSGNSDQENLEKAVQQARMESDRLAREIDNVNNAWRQAWSAYQSQSKLLDLDLMAAEAAKGSSQQTLEHVQAKSKQGLVGAQEVREAEANDTAANFQLEKAREVIRMWQELEKNEPDLNPEWKPADVQKP